MYPSSSLAPRASFVALFALTWLACSSTSDAPDSQLGDDNSTGGAPDASGGNLAAGGGTLPTGGAGIGGTGTGGAGTGGLADPGAGGAAAGGAGSGGDIGTGGDVVGTGGDLGTGGVTVDLPVLSPDGNPVLDWFEGAREEWPLSSADIVLSYQQDNGGWPKNLDYSSMGSGGNDLGTFDNGATVTEAVYLAEVYRQTNDTKYRDAVREALDYILEAQYDTGGWPQFYPLRGGYSDHVTFNDNAMAHVLTVLHQAAEQAPPFDGDIASEEDRNAFRQAIAGGIDYILKSQWEQNGTLTVWCAQHGEDDYLPKEARAYELESLSGSESVGVIAFLMTQPQSPEIETAVRAAVDWYRSPDTYLDGYTYDTSQDNPIVAQQGSRIWYRFYDLYSNAGFFSDRDGGTYYDIMEISEERRSGYRWGGNWGERIISYADSVGY